MKEQVNVAVNKDIDTEQEDALKVSTDDCSLQEVISGLFESGCLSALGSNFRITYTSKNLKLSHIQYKMSLVGSIIALETGQGEVDGLRSV